MIGRGSAAVEPRPTHPMHTSYYISSSMNYFRVTSTDRDPRDGVAEALICLRECVFPEMTTELEVLAHVDVIGCRQISDDEAGPQGWWKTTITGRLH